ncbi:hypothetical protein DICA0_E24806 [Diutina catenulata]
MNTNNPSPPQISLTPSASASSKPRSRAGTLPSSLFSASSVSSSPSATDALGLPTMESLTLPSTAIDIPSSSPQPRPRVRSGSLFSTNSIWNDGAPGSSPQSVRSFEPDQPFLAVPSDAPHQRNRSYTTTGAQMPPQPYSLLESIGGSRVSPFASTSNKTDVNALLDSLMSNINDPGYSPAPRLRSQTISGPSPGADSFMASQYYQSSVVPVMPSNQPMPMGQPVSMGQPASLSQPSMPLLPQLQQPPQPQQSQSQPMYPSQPSPPQLIDDFNLSQVAITTNFDNPNLGPTKHILLDNLPQFINSAKLFSILNSSLGNQRQFGGIRSVRLAAINASKLALVECSNVDTAMSLKASFNHVEFVPGVVLYVAFAKVTDLDASSGNGSAGAESYGGQSAPSSTHGSSQSTHAERSSPPSAPASAKGYSKNTEKPPPTDLVTIKPEFLNVIAQLAAGSPRIVSSKIESMVNHSIAYDNSLYCHNFGPLPDAIPLRQFDSPTLRELRKVLENTETVVNGGHDSGAHSHGSHELAPPEHPRKRSNSGSPPPSDRVMSQLELEELCVAMLDELPELCYDYLGNTIVQKLFVLVESPAIKLMMVREIAPYFTQLAIHKNGTWAVQKIIALAANGHAQQMELIGSAIKPYAVKLFNDQFGNYVLQGCVKFGSPFNDFIFETMLDNFLEISFGRFGARSIRTILETADSGFVPPEQLLMVAGLIVQFANELVVNANGSLLITWFLDTFVPESTPDCRFALLTSRFLPNLARLATHKLANLTILKIVNNRSDPISKRAVLDALFGPFDPNSDFAYPTPTRLLELILAESHDHNPAGPLFVYKLVSNPVALQLGDDPRVNGRYSEFAIAQVKRVLLESNIANLQPYKKLMEEVGLPISRLGRSSSVGAPSGSRRGKRMGQGSRNGHKGYGNGYYEHQGQQPQHQQPQQPQQQSQQQYSQQYQQQQYPAGPMHVLSHQQQQQQQPVYMQQPQPPQVANDKQPSQQDMAVMKQLEQLSLSSAAMGYNSNPGTPTVNKHPSQF